MAGAAAQLVPLPSLPNQFCPNTQTRFPPINFIYGHFHNSIRAELSILADRVRSLEVPGEGVDSMLSDLRERYRFLEQVYKYHSTVEDEVLYPALNAKVPNVTQAYSIEHQDEEVLLEQLIQLLTTALEEIGGKRKGTIRELICKVEEVHTTLRKHLAKEEQQLLPLLLQHFSFAEQAELVAQFLYSIPLETVERVLSHLKPRIPSDEQEQLLIEIRNVIPGKLLSQLLVTWLRHEPEASIAQVASSCSGGAGERPAAASFVCCGDPSACMYGPRPNGASAAAVPCCGVAAAASSSTAASAAALNLALHMGPQAAAEAPLQRETTTCRLGDRGAAALAAVAGSNDAEVSRRAPLRDIIHFHRIICSSLGDFAREARALQLGGRNGDVTATAAQLSALLERHRFLRSVYVFHSISEEEVLFPEVQRLAAADVDGGAAHQCERDHQAELSRFEDMGRLLADVRAFARRGRKEVASMLEKLCCSAEAVHASIRHHMQREEADVFPLLEAHLCEAQQRLLVYRTLRAMPLRLLERVMPWVVSGLDDDDAASLLSNIRLGAPPGDLPLVELLSRWARRGRPGIGGSTAQQYQHQRVPLEAAAPAMLTTAAQPGPGAGSRPGPESALGPRPRALPISLAPAWPGDAATASELLTEAGVGAEASGMGAQSSEGDGRDAQVCSDTCGPRFFRESFAGGCTSRFVAMAVDDDGAVSKRLRPVSAEPPAQMPMPPHGGGVPDTDLWVGGVGAAGPGGAGGDPFSAAELESSTVPLALLCGRQAGGGSQDGGELPQGLRPLCAHGQGGASPEASGGAGDGGRGTAGGGGDGGGSSASSGYNPIDHIFQFHKALRQELKQMEADAMRLEHVVLAWVRQQQQQQLQTLSTAPASTEDGAVLSARHAATLLPAALQVSAPPGSTDGAAAAASSAVAATARGGLLPVLQNFQGRFQFLQGIYRAHSKSEDEIVFPALEAKQALRNVSHAYTLDHRQEEQLFADLEMAIDKFRAVDLLRPGHEEELSRQVMGVRRMCAAIRASLETHIRSEESELWPLFTEHFSREEQQYLVGVIIGRTGAQVLQALLPWVSDTFSAEERDAMMDSLRAATRNTMFDQWLEAVQAGAGAGGAGVSGGGSGLDSGTPSRASSMGVGEPGLASYPHHPHHPHHSQQQQEPLQQVVEYLAGAGGGTEAAPGGAGAVLGSGGSGCPGCCSGGAAASGGGGGGGSLADSTSFRPGWEDIFRVNQQQLEAAIHRVSNDSSLEPERKAYLMQNIMVSKYIVAQQRRMGSLEAIAGGGGGAGGCAAQPGRHHHHQPQLQQLLLEGGAAAAAASGAVAGAAAANGGGSGDGDGKADVILRTYHDAAAGALGCKHYRRKCQLVAPCCGLIFTCRLCHDEACDHRMDRYAVSEMRCMLCGSRQPVASSCRGCGAAMARYVCNICHLFDDEPGKDIYHCPFCNVCRRGRGLGVDFFHCMNCNACMSLSLFSSHKCREKCIEGNCPVCHEALFDSSQPIKELPCGHFMHSSCFLTYTRYNYTCPLCCKSAGDMSVYFNMLDSLLASERLPPEYAGRMQQVLCNDCGKMGFAPFHFVYHSCPHCRSYNTRVL